MAGKPFHPTVGERFVFYNSLKDEDSNIKFYNGLYDEALNELQEIQTELSYDPNDRDNKISALLNFLRKTIAFERQNEKVFLESKIVNNPTLKSVPAFSQALAKSFPEKGEINYPAVINILNIALKNSKDYRTNLRYEKERLEELTQKIH